jgi:hypothetical protein
MYIECLIKRSDDSDTFVDFEQVRYRFTKNELGDRVCFVGGDKHRKRLLMMGAQSYREYKPKKKIKGAMGAAPEPMTRNILRKKSNPEPPTNDQGDAIEALTAEPDKPVLVDYDWDLDKKVAKVKSFKFLGEQAYREFIELNREGVMKWPIDVRREVAKKLENMMPEEDPGIQGFIIDDYLRKGSPGDT